MHYIARIMDGTVKSLPPFLPPAIYTAASGLPAPVSPTAAAASLAPIARHLTGGIPAAISPVIRHNTDTLTGSPSAPLSMQLTGSNAFASKFGGGRTTIGLDTPEWDVTAEDKAKYDKFFDKIDTTRMGVVQGENGFPFSLKGKAEDGKREERKEDGKERRVRGREDRERKDEKRVKGRKEGKRGKDVEERRETGQLIRGLGI